MTCSVSVVSGARPIERESEHYFVKLGDFEALLREWVSKDRLHEMFKAVDGVLRENPEVGAYNQTI